MSISPSEPHTSVAWVFAALTAAKLDQSRVGVLVYRGKLVVTPKEYLDHAWREYNDILVGLGFGWVRAGKLSRWEADQAPT